MQKEPLFINEYRMDGRKANENRKISIKTNVKWHTTGSCEFRMGETLIEAWIEGPRESKNKSLENKGEFICEYVQAPYSYLTVKDEDRRDMKMRDFGKTMENIFREVIRLELYAKSEIVLKLVVYNNDGNFKGASINAATLALINAGIYIKDTVIGMNVGVVDEDTVLYDLKIQEEKDYIPILNVAYLAFSKKFIFIEMINAKTKYSKIQMLMGEAEKASRSLFDEEHRFLKEEYEKSTQEASEK
ncbi:MAG: hypothetical protein MJ252_16055 [archaeon]|nr:hypothetical protein [archaeon]